jgi:hypothetical protein
VNNVRSYYLYCALYSNKIITVEVNKYNELYEMNRVGILLASVVVTIFVSVFLNLILHFKTAHTNVCCSNSFKV